jgi:hypothetical protein
MLSRKCKEVELEIEFVNKEKQKLLEFQERLMSDGGKCEVEFDFERAVRELGTEIELPVLEIFTELPELIPAFRTIFAQKYAIKVLSPEESKLLVDHSTDAPTRNTERHPSHYSSFQSFKTICRLSEDGLYCDEEFGEGRSNRTHDFSFEQGGESGRAECIL